MNELLIKKFLGLKVKFAEVGIKLPKYKQIIEEELASWEQWYLKN